MEIEEKHSSFGLNSHGLAVGGFPYLQVNYCVKIFLENRSRLNAHIFVCYNEEFVLKIEH